MEESQTFRIFIKIKLQFCSCSANTTTAFHNDTEQLFDLSIITLFWKQLIGLSWLSNYAGIQCKDVVVTN